MGERNEEGVMRDRRKTVGGRSSLKKGKLARDEKDRRARRRKKD
jgi:hypothetical protein